MSVDKSKATSRPWRFEFDEYAGYDCMTGGYQILGAVSGLNIFTIDCGPRGEEDDKRADAEEANAFIEKVRLYFENGREPTDERKE